MIKHVTLNIIALFLLLLPATSEAGIKLNVTFKDHVVMKKSVLTVQDVIDAQETDVSFLEKYGHIKITDETDTFDVVPRSMLYSLLINGGADLRDLKIKMTSGIEIERGQEFSLNLDTEKKVLNQILSRYNLARNEVKILKAKILPRIEKESMNSLLVRSVQVHDLKNLKNAKFIMVAEDIDGRATKHILYVDFDIETSVLVAKEDIPAGESFDKESFFVGRKKIKHIEGRIIRDRDLRDKAFKMVRAIRKGDVLTEETIRSSVLVKEGKIVTISYKSSSLNITALGKLHTTGEVGQVVRVENVDSKKIISGRLVSPDWVEVISVQ